MYGGKEKWMRGIGGETWRKDTIWNADVKKRITLKRILKDQGAIAWAGLIWLNTWTNGGLLLTWNEPSGCTKCGELLQIQSSSDEGLRSMELVPTWQKHLMLHIEIKLLYVVWTKRGTPTHTAWAARSALQTVTGRTVIPKIFISSENNTSKWVKRPAAANVAHTGPRYNLTLRNAAQCTGAASGRAAHQSTAQRATLTDETFVQQNVITCPYSLQYCGANCGLW
jgi:hypothetical protein